MIAVVTLILWLVVLTLGLYAVFSDKGSGDFPAVPADADVIIISSNYTICVPNPGAGNSGIEGNGSIIYGNIDSKTYGSALTPPTAGCLDSTFGELTYNTFILYTNGQPGTTTYVLISTNSTQSVIDHYFPASEGWIDG